MNNNEAFMEWLKENYPDYPPPLSEVWQAATKASESEINSLKERVAELQSHLSSQSIEIAHNDVTLESYAHKVAELQTHINDLREALETISDWRFGWEGDCGVTSVANNALSSTPAQSLAEYRNSIIKECAETAYTYLDDPYLSGHGYATGCSDAILELKVTL